MLTPNGRFGRRTAAIAALLVAGCAGGGLQSQPPLASALQADANQQHAQSGAALLYAGTLTQTSTGGNSTTYKLSQRVTSSATTSGGRALTDYHGVETQSVPGTNLTTTYDAYVAQVASKTRKGTDVDLVKTVSSSSDGISQTVDYGAGNGVVDQLPEIPQASWNNAATRMQSIADSIDESSVDDFYNADGSYTEKAVPVEGLQATAQSYPDGNAVYEWPYAGSNVNTSITFAPPDAGKLRILVSNGGLHVTTFIRLKSWYPSNPLVLAADTFQDLGSVTVPAECKVPQSYAKTATEIVENVTRLDVIFGEYETTQRTEYLGAPYGLVCLTAKDDLQTYYNYTALAIAQKPLSEATSDEVIGLRHATASQHTEAAVALPLDARLTAWRAARRLATDRAIAQSLKRVWRKR
jgi:hypothetical protein